MNSLVRKNIADGVYLNAVKDNRFKTMRISVKIIVPLNKDTAAQNALLCGVLSRSCKAYPDFTLFSKKLSSLYGADLSSGVRKMGDAQVITLSIGGLDDRYAFGNEEISKEFSKLLCEVIFNPNITDGQFNEKDIEQERRQLLDLIDSEFNDKRAYAISQLVSNMCKDEIFGIKRYGTAEDIKKLTSSDLYNAWKNILKNARFEIFYIGDSSSDKVENVFKEAFSKIDRMPCKVNTEIVRTANEVKRVVEEFDVSQAKLVMGFRGGVADGDDEKKVTAARLMCAILGGTASSKLFNNVREKQSLCYYCASRYDCSKGILMVDSGVEGENLEKTEKAILKEIDDMKNGVISDFEIEATKLAVINSFRTSNDAVQGIETWYSSQLFSPAFKSIEQLSAEFNAVTKEEIVEAANKLSLDTVYILKNK